MTWRRRLPKPLYLNDGRTLTTLAQARDAMLELPGRRRADQRWQDAAELLLQAVYRNRFDPISDAEKQLSKAFEADGLI